MESKTLEELLDEVSAILDKHGLVLCIKRKTRDYNYSAEVKKAMYGNNNIRKRREELGLTEQQLAKEMGIDRNLVARIERKDMLHTEKSMQRFADYFGCTIEDLLVGDENE